MVGDGRVADGRLDGGDERGTERGVTLVVALGADVGQQFVARPDDRRLGDPLDADDGRLDLRRAEPAAGDVDDVVDAAQQGDVAVVVDSRAVAREVDPPVGVLPSLRGRARRATLDSSSGA